MLTKTTAENPFQETLYQSKLSQKYCIFIGASSHVVNNATQLANYGQKNTLST